MKSTLSPNEVFFLAVLEAKENYKAIHNGAEASHR